MKAFLLPILILGVSTYDYEGKATRHIFGSSKIIKSLII